MITLAILAALVLLGVAGTVREVLLDRPAEIPRSRLVDPDSLPPSVRRPVV